MKRFGRCLCGALRLDLECSGGGIDVCHCRNCQMQSGSAFAPFLAVALSALNIQGNPKCYRDSDTVSGQEVERFFCGDCGSPTYVRVASAPNTAYVFTGLLGDVAGLAPKVHGWTSQKHQWTEINPSVPSFALDPGLSPE